MTKIILSMAIACVISGCATTTDSLISIESSYGVTETADRFQNIIKDKGLSVFGRIDHSENASGVNLELSPTEVIIFGNPKVGTPLMNCSNTAAIDLPQKALFWKDAEGKVWLSYNNPKYIKERHKITNCDEVINKVSDVLGKLSKAATSR